VALAETAVIALHGRFDEAGGIVRSTLETVLTEAYRLGAAEAGVSPKLAKGFASEGGLRGRSSGMPLNRGPDQLAQFLLVHSTHSS
jgi:hypothetical protein